MARNRNVVPWADLSSMSPNRLTELFYRATRREERMAWLPSQRPMSQFWRDTSDAASFTIEDRLYAAESTH